MNKTPEQPNLQRTVMVRRATVTQASRRYGHPDLLALDGVQVTLEFDHVKQDAVVIRNLDGQWICDALLVKAVKFAS